MMLGVLLARAGVDVLVLEQHGDFLRDFRGDTIHPSTLEVMHELGALDEFLARPHQEIRQLRAHVGGAPMPVADFTHLSTRCRFLAIMPQWDFLDFLAGHAAAHFPAFHLRMRTEVRELIEEGGRVVGVRCETPEGRREVRADLVVGADGRHSVVRQSAGLPAREFGAPMDVLWFRLARRRSDPVETLGYFEAGQIFIMIDRGDYWQCGYVIPKGSLEELRAKGLEVFRDRLSTVVPFFKERLGEIPGWEALSLLTVRVDRLQRWYRPGLLCIGDAAHAMSPIGGVGINLAIQDAVAAANILAAPLRASRATVDDLRRVQRRRELPTRITQGIQLFLQRSIVAPALRGRGSPRAPLLLRLLTWMPVLQRIPARLIGIGVRPEHVRTPVERADLAAR